MRAMVFGAAAAGLLAMTAAQAEGVGVVVKAGTLGGGVEIAKSINPKFNARLGYNTFSTDDSSTEGGINYDISLKLGSAALLLDWHPFAGGLRATVGALYNGNKLEMTATPTGTYDIGGTSYTASEVGTLTGEVTFDDFAPYVGIGWGNAVEEGQKLMFALDIGVAFQGSPKADLTANGTLASDPTFQANLAAEEAQLNSDLEDFKIYPVIAVGIGYHF